jgi:glucose-6-phosphate 1-dehydrogenase
VNNEGRLSFQNFQVKPEEEEKAEQFWQSNGYVAGGYDKGGDFENLNKEILNLEKNRTVANRLFYLALPPSVFEPVTLHLKVAFWISWSMKLNKFIACFLKIS